MPFAEINGLNYHYEVSGSGPLLVLLHGFTGSLANWQPHAEAFAAQYQVLTVDLPGHGRTDAPEAPARYAMPQVAADVMALAAQVGQMPAHLLGYSMGGRLALYMAVQNPAQVRSLVLESASPGLADAAAREARIQQDEALAARIERKGVEAFVDYWEQIPLFASQQRLSVEIRQRLRQQRLKNNPRGLANSLRGMGTGVQPSLWQQPGGLVMPVLLMAGALDTKFAGIGQQMYDLMPDARLEVVPDAGHTLHLEAPEWFQAQVLEFLARQ